MKIDQEPSVDTSVPNFRPRLGAPYEKGRCSVARHRPARGRREGCRNPWFYASL